VRRKGVEERREDGVGKVGDDAKARE
jgi:hypothetical protein